MKNIEYRTIAITDEDTPDEVAYKSVLNQISENAAVTRAMVTELYGLYESLKPLLGSMPAMPAGLVLPPIPGKVRR